MSAPVDVLAVMDELAGKVWRADDSDPILALADKARAAVAELIEADSAFDAAASEVATYEAMTPYPSRNYRTVCYVQYREAMARRAAALARFKGGAA